MLSWKRDPWGKRSLRRVAVQGKIRTKGQLSTQKSVAGKYLSEDNLVLERAQGIGSRWELTGAWTPGAGPLVY